MYFTLQNFICEKHFLHKKCIKKSIPFNYNLIKLMFYEY